MQYRREIDGLRTVAVMPVILFHAGLSVFSGGYVGVDIFFVISGFLITTILINELDAGTFSILRFYERRMRRILPALAVVVLACIPFAWFWLLPTAFKDFGQSVLAVALFASNILFWTEEDYFDTAAELKPLLHTWSLAVEEQYYIVFPVLLFLLWRMGHRGVFWVTCAIAAASLIYTEIARLFTDTTRSTLFYLPFARAWELLVGSLAAFVMVYRPPSKNDLWAILGLVLIVVSIFGFDDQTPFPSAYTVLPVVGTALILIFGQAGTIVARMLSVPLFVGIGLISYSAYLWHQPLFAFARLQSLHEPDPWLMAFLVIASLVLAALSWRFVEQPFRKGPASWLPTRAGVFAASLAILAAMAVFGIYGHMSGGAPQRAHLAAVSGYQWDRKTLQNESWRHLRQISGARGYGVAGHAFDQADWFPDSARPRLLVVGNSHSKDVFNALLSAKTVTARFDVARFGAQVKDLSVLSHPLFSSPNFRASDVIVIATRFDDDDVAQLSQVIAALKAADKQLVVINTTPEFADTGNATLADMMVLDGYRDQNGALSAQINAAHWDDLPHHAAVAARRISIAEIAAELDVPLLDRKELMCQPEAKSCTAVAADLTKFFYDYGHTTLAGAAYFGQRIDAMDWFTQAVP